MSDDDLYQNLPQDPERAFLMLESHFRQDCDQRIAKAHEDENTSVFHVDYIAQVVAAISELGLTAEFADRVPLIENVDYSAYLNFSKDVKHYRTMLEIRHGRRVQGHSVRFDPATKQKMRHHLNQLREIFDKLEVEERKKNALFGRLNDLQEEIDRDRTRFDTYAALAIETSSVVGDVVDKSQVLNLLNGIARVIWGAKEGETKRLPPTTPPKRIEPPRAPKPQPKKDDLDDEIPF